MKTIEEKAKAYDEALERAEHVKLTNTKEIVAAAEYIFPELSESEDERIRKWIVAEIKHQYLVDGKKIYCEEAKDALAYLKKQKEQNSDDVKKDDRDSDEERWTPTPTALHALYDASIGAKLTREDRNELYAIYLYLTDNRKDK